MAYEKAFLAGGCFWGMQDLIAVRRGCNDPCRLYRRRRGERDLPQSRAPMLRPSKLPTIRHARASAVSLEFFFQIHDPTTPNRQGNDRGLSYRSAIFYVDDEQRRVAKETIADVEASGLWPGLVVTEVAPAGPFWEAEPEHQDYLERHPNGYTCHFVRPNWRLPVRSAAE